MGGSEVELGDTWIGAALSGSGSVEAKKKIKMRFLPKAKEGKIRERPCRSPDISL
jgi:Cu/Ag efflux pump CusA